MISIQDAIILYLTSIIVHLKIRLYTARTAFLSINWLNQHVVALKASILYYFQSHINYDQNRYISFIKILNITLNHSLYLSDEMFYDLFDNFVDFFVDDNISVQSYLHNKIQYQNKMHINSSVFFLSTCSRYALQLAHHETSQIH